MIVPFEKLAENGLCRPLPDGRGSVSDCARATPIPGCARRRAARQRGSTLVESALVLLAFLIAVIGILDMSQILFTHNTLVERVREGLRYGVITYDATKIRNVVLYGTATPADNATPPFHLTSNMVQVSRLDVNQPEDRVMITVSNYPVDFYTPFIAGRYTGKPIVGVLSMEVGNLP